MSTISMRARLGFFAGLTSLLAPWRTQRARAAEAPDIVVLLLNDARDGDEIAMPQTMARLRDGGTTFPNFFLTTPLCCPSRATIFTGLYSHNTGVYENSDGPNGGWLGFARRGNRPRTTGILLQDAGYRTVAIGGYLNGKAPGRGPEPGWDVGPHATGKKKRQKRKKHGRRGRNHRRHKARAEVEAQKSKRADSNDGQRAAAAAAALRNAPLTQPLYLHIGFSVPHVPANPVPPYAGQFSGARVDRDDRSFNEADTGDKPRYIRSLGSLSSADQAWLDEQHQRRLECLLELDDHIATIWSALEERGRLDRTYVFLLTDNGYMLGQHRYYGKHVPYDGSARMPLYAYGPGFAPGAVDGRLVGNVDLAPTLADLASANGHEMDGVSLLSTHERDAILLEFLAPKVNSMKWPGPRTEVTRYSALRTQNHLYVEYRGGERELYDYAGDPHETQNLLAGVPSAEAVALAGELNARLGELRNCRGAACL